MVHKMIIDGWNVCWKIPEISTFIPENLEMARRKLNARVKSYCQCKKIQYKIIYDGQPHIYSKSVHMDKSPIQFSKDPQKADSLIIDFLRKQKNSREWTVITSDRELIIRVKNLEAQVITSESFIEKIKSKTVKESGISVKENPNVNKDDIQYWLKRFRQK